MGSNRFGLYGAVIVASLSISLTLSACQPQPGSGDAIEKTAVPSVTPTASPEPTVSATAIPTSSKPPTTTTPSPSVPAPSAAPMTPVQPALKSFTFPDGHISFSYPASWSVKTQRGPGREGPPWQPLEAIVSDGSGNDLLRVSSGADGIGCASGPTKRTVFDKAAVPGMRNIDGITPMFGFTVDNSGEDWYVMAVMRPNYLAEGDVSSTCTLLAMGNGGAAAGVIFNKPAFPGREAAKAWMATAQYAQLKALMMSLAYS